MTTEENVELEKFEDTLIDALKNATKSGKPLNFKQERMALGLRTSEECLGHFRAFLAEQSASRRHSRRLRLRPGRAAGGVGLVPTPVANNHSNGYQVYLVAVLVSVLRDYKTSRANIASATFVKPAVLAPLI